MLAGTRWISILFCVFALNTSAFSDHGVPVSGTENGETFSYDDVVHAFEVAGEFISDATPNMYRTPRKLVTTMEDSKLSCVQLDNTIVALEPLTYRVVPGFYDGDIYQTVAFWTGTTLFHESLGLPLIPENVPLVDDVPLPYAYFGYVAYKRYQESERISRVSYRISQLRRVKAQKRCFEI